MKTITYSLQCFDASATLSAETFAQAFPFIAESKMLYLGDAENNTVAFVDADKAYQGLNFEQAVKADQGNIHVAVETLAEIEKLLAQISQFKLDWDIVGFKYNPIMQYMNIDLRFRTDELDDVSDTLQSNSKLRFNMVSKGVLSLDLDSISNTTVSLYAGLDIMSQPEYRSVVFHDKLNDFIKGFDQDDRHQVSLFMVQFIENEFKKAILNNADSVSKLVNSEIMEH
jgi:hypothetical protein